MLIQLISAVLLLQYFSHPVFAQGESNPASEVAPSTAAEQAAQPTSDLPPPIESGEMSETEITSPPLTEPARVGPFQGGWEEATLDERSLFLEVYGESRSFLQERWDKSNPEERKRLLKNYPLLSQRTLKHSWSSATPEERAAFLEAHPKTGEKVRKGWDDATPEQRKMLAKEHPYLARKALYHSWTYATPQEKIAYLDAYSDLRMQLKSKWAGANSAQKAWYKQNYAGLGGLSDGKSWADTSLVERAAFLEANPAIMERLRSGWDKGTPEARAQRIRNWSGWPLKDLTTKTDKTTKAGASPHKKVRSMNKRSRSAP